MAAPACRPRSRSAALDRELSLAARTDAPLAVLIFDLDHFKKLNDTFGHQAGDDVLRGVGAALRSSARLGDVDFADLIYLRSAYFVMVGTRLSPLL